MKLPIYLIIIYLFSNYWFSHADVLPEIRKSIEKNEMNTYLKKISLSLEKLTNILGGLANTSKSAQTIEDKFINACDTSSTRLTSSEDFAVLEFNSTCVCTRKPLPCQKVWNISTTPGSQVELQLQDVDVKGGEKCAVKTLKIYEGFNSINNDENQVGDSPIFKNCVGRFPPENIISEKNYVIVVAEVAVMTSLPMFRLRHRAVDVKEPSMEKIQMDKRISIIMAKSDKSADTTCSDTPTVLTSDYGVLYSPNYELGKKYPNDASCSWLITVDPGKIIILSIISFSLEQAFPFTLQCFDYVKIYDSPQPNLHKLFGTYCGSDAHRPPGTIRSTSNQMLVIFESDNANNDMGFAAKYSAQSTEPAATTKNPKTHKAVLTCGKPTVQPKIYNRIVGGVVAVAHSWPWMVGVRLANEHVCGGALLDENWVITAAHCLVDQNTDLIDVVLGDHNNSLTEGTEEYRNIQKIIIHPEYSTVTSDFDISLIRLNKPATMNERIQPICLRRSPSTSRLTCVVCGWGKTRDTGPDDVLNQLLVPILDTELCSSWYRGMFTRNMMCAGYAEGRRDSCQGDSGGPLVCSDGKVWHLAGVTSWGFDCAKPKKPGVYTNVTSFIDWIVSNTFD